MKKTYITPQTIVVLAQCEMLVAASRFDNTKDEQDIIPSDDEEYNQEFSAKEYYFSNSF